MMPQDAGPMAALITTDSFSGWSGPHEIPEKRRKSDALSCTAPKRRHPSGSPPLPANREPAPAHRAIPSAVTVDC
jgi:hypothetical protein